MDINRLFNFYRSAFVAPFLAEAGQTIRRVADIGTGYGWLAIAFAMETTHSVVAVDFNQPRLEAARRIARIVGVDRQIEWVAGSIGCLPFAAMAFDAVFCVEVIEHVSVQPDILQDLARIARDHLTITTPNKWSPVVFHDTSLPFCHWLPPHRRDRYAALFGRSHRQDNNLFWSPRRLLAALPDFQLQSSPFRLLLPNLKLHFRRAR